MIRLTCLRWCIWTILHGSQPHISLSSHGSQGRHGTSWHICVVARRLIICICSYNNVLVTDHDNQDSTYLVAHQSSNQSLEPAMGHRAPHSDRLAADSHTSSRRCKCYLRVVVATRMESARRPSPGDVRLKTSILHLDCPEEGLCELVFQEEVVERHQTVHIASG